MRKLLSNGLVAFAGLVSLPLATHPGANFTPSADYRDDPRLQSLRSFLEEGDCPVAALAGEFLRAADEHDLDWRLLPSISFVESTGGKAAKNNNLFGWDSGKAEFASMTDAIFEVAFRLTNSQLYRNKDTEGILAIYNPNADYAQRVKAVMRRISPAE